MSQGSQLSLFDSRDSSQPFAVRVSPRARRLTVRVHVGGRVEVIVPQGISAGMVRSFVTRNTGWIDRKVAQMVVRPAPVAVVPDTVHFAATGERFEVNWVRAERRRVAHDPARVHLQSREVSGALVLLREWLMHSARRRLVPQLWDLVREFGLGATGVTVRRQRTRWGSCSSRGRISLNCSLLFMPPAVVRYLMIHELAHLKHLNHSDAFWSSVEQYEPRYRSLDRELTAGWRAVPDWVFKG